MTYEFLGFTLIGLLALLISWIILSIPIYISADILAKSSDLLQAMFASFLIVVTFFFFSLIPVFGVIIWIIFSIIIIALIYEASFIRAFLIAIVAIIIYIIMAIILALIFGIAIVTIFNGHSIFMLMPF
ncbi:MAG: hypothetical protein ACYDAO_08950 [Thermoplasmataceae archaeon]